MWSDVELKVKKSAYKQLLKSLKEGDMVIFSGIIEERGTVLKCTEVEAETLELLGTEVDPKSVEGEISWKTFSEDLHLNLLETIEL